MNQPESIEVKVLARMLSPREIVSELDRYIVGQNNAKRAVAIALRNRWRRLQLTGPMRDEVHPKNILMIGPTGCGKTEIARRLAKLVNAPFLKVEATKFTEVGYVGRDVEQIIRDLLEAAIGIVKIRKRADVETRARHSAEERILDALVGTSSSQSTRESFRSKLRSGDLDDKEIEISLQSGTPSMPVIDLPGSAGGGFNTLAFGEILGKAFNSGPRTRRVKVRDAADPIVSEECEKLIDSEQAIQEAIKEVENNGIVFLDEIDKICTGHSRTGGEVSREGVQRDLLPLIEGTVVATKHGSVRTDHVLFIASGAFHVSKPSDLLPELQGRLPIRVELSSLDEDDFCRILTETEACLIKQYVALLGTENFEIGFAPDAIREIARVAVQINGSVENIGARRLQTVMEKILDDISYSAPDRSGQHLMIDAAYVRSALGNLVQNVDLARYIL